MSRSLRGFVLLLTAAAIHLSAIQTLFAQALVPPKGEGALTITYQNYYVTGHFDVSGNKNKNGATHTKTIVTELDYALTDTVGLNVTLPFIASKYTGGSSYFVAGIETFPGPLDDGTYHAAFQDVRVEVRRMFVGGSITVTPFVGASFPTHEYETVGEAVPGRRRREFQVGANAATSLDHVLPHLYVHGRYAYAAAQKVAGFPATRSIIDLEAGGAPAKRIGVRGLVTWQIRHAGPRPPELRNIWIEHDRFIMSGYFNVGGGVSCSLRRSTELYASWIATVSGHDGAHVSRTFTVGTTWSFGGGLGSLGAGLDGNATPARSQSPSTLQAAGSGT